jgi:hypothetical protein
MAASPPTTFFEHCAAVDLDACASTAALYDQLKTVVGTFACTAHNYDLARDAEEALTSRYENLVVELPTTASAEQLADNAATFLALRKYKALLCRVEAEADALHQLVHHHTKNNNLKDIVKNLLTVMNCQAIAASGNAVTLAVDDFAALVGDAVANAYATYTRLLAAVDAARAQRAVAFAQPKLVSGIAAGFMPGLPPSPWDKVADGLATAANAPLVAATVALCTSDVRAQFVALFQTIQAAATAAASQ